MVEARRCAGISALVCASKMVALPELIRTGIAPPPSQRARLPSSPDWVMRNSRASIWRRSSDAVRLADVIETLDRPRLADAIAAAMAKEGRTPQLLIEVNTGDEAQKSGVPRAEADGFIDECKARFGSALVGLMCVPPLEADPRPHFEWLAERAARHALTVLSMGMSADFELAIACGATWVRVGSAIFGHRS